MTREETMQQINRVFELLGNPLRMKIFMKILAEGCDCDINEQTGLAGNCVKGIMKELNLPQSTASTYIKDLESGGLIECTKNGKYVYCRPHKDTLRVVKGFIDSVLSQIKNG